MVADVVRRLSRFDALAATAGLWFVGKFVRYAFPPLFETLGDTYGVSRTVLGTAFTGFMLVYAAMQFPSGLVADRLGSVRVIATGALVTAAGALALVVDTPFVVLAGAMVVMGAGTGVHKTVSVELLSRVYPARTGRALGIFDTFGSLAGAAAPAAVVVAVGFPSVFGDAWRTLFLAAGLTGLALTAVFLARVPRHLQTETGDVRSDGSQATASLGTYLALFRRWRFSTFVGVTLMFSFAYNGAVAFLPLYLASETTLSSVTANLLFSALFLVSLVQLVTGEASDRVGNLPILVLTLGVATAGLLAVLALSATGGALTLGAAVVALGLGAHGFRPVRGAYLMSIVPTSVASGGLGVVRTLLMGAGAIAPAIVGYLSETVGFGAAFGLLAASLTGATALSVALWALE